MIVALLCVVGFAASAALTWGARGYALRRAILDLPNARSSHTVPTPRGGGIAFVVAMLGLALAERGALGAPRPLFAALVGAGGAMALVGFLDDHGHVSAGRRLAAHFAAAAWALVWLGPHWIPGFFGAAAWATAVGYVVAALGVVWLLNLYNFMDGIDGIASVEAITVCVPGAALGFAVAPASGWESALLLAACTAGFLVWNFPPPARIFMGDSGSNFLGVSLAILAMSAAAESSRLLWCWGILLGAFIVDATVTLVRRLVRRERVYEAHRSHAYQYASRRYGGHLPITLTVGAINVLWLAPIAAAVAFGKIAGAVGLALAYAPLVAIAVRYKAGAAKEQEV